MKLDEIKKLHKKKYRQLFGHFLVEGEHLVLELEKAAKHMPHWQQAHLYVTTAYEHWPSPWPKHVVSDRADGTAFRYQNTSGHPGSRATATSRRHRNHSQREGIVPS